MSSFQPPYPHLRLIISFTLIIHIHVCFCKNIKVKLVDPMFCLYLYDVRIDYFLFDNQLEDSTIRKANSSLLSSN